MPYTPPSRSVASTSPPGSPGARRKHTEPALSITLPRSSSYLTKHRRTPSAVSPTGQGDDILNHNLTPPGTSDDLKAMGASDSIRQSPPPVTGPGGIPSGAVISPPDSLSGSDDEGLMMRGRKITNLKELKAAVSNISVHRGSSPSSARLPLALSKAVSLTEGMHHSFSTGALDALGSQRNDLSDLDTGAEAIVVGSPLTASEEDSDDEKRVKPPMVRKKSGELVRPALRASSCRRPTSMPGTPTFAKAVHFDAHLEHIRHFLQVDRPLAVSAGSSPVENFDSDSEYPFPSSEDEAPRSRSPPYEWELNGSNLSSSSDVARNSLPAKVERFWLSKDCKSLQGSVAVANLAFNKHIMCRFTLDQWKTTSEVAAEYTGQIHGTGRERWTFTIRLSDMANLETKTMYFCIRYNVNGQEYWDNNGGANFRVGFHKKYLLQNGKGSYRGAGVRAVGELPRSSRRANPDSASRPKSTPLGLAADGFSGTRHTFDQARDAYVDESVPIRLKRHTANSRSEDFTSSTAPRNQAFGRRYDFNASLHEAQQSARVRDSRAPTDVNANVNRTAKSKSPILPHSGQDSPSRKDYTYDEIVNRFCFYGSKQLSTKSSKEGSSGPSKVDGNDDTFGSMNGARGHYHHAPPLGLPITPSRPDSEHSQAGTGGINSSMSPSPPRSNYLPGDPPSGPSMRPASPGSNFSPRAVPRRMAPPPSMASIRGGQTT